MSAEQYRFVTEWRVRGTIDDVADVIADIEALPEWWPAVYLDVEESCLEERTVDLVARAVHLLWRQSPDEGSVTDINAGMNQP